MKQSEFSEFSDALSDLADLYGKAPLSANALRIYWVALEACPLRVVQQALNLHVRDPQAGKFMPKPADIIGQIERNQPAAHPSEDEAWAMCVRMTGEEDTAIITGEMAEAWAVSWPVMDLGDKVGARMAFKDAYRNAVARSSGNPTWEVRRGTDKQICAMRVQEAVMAGKLSPTALEIHGLPAPTRGVAGLLEGAKEAVRLAAEDGRIVDHATRAIAHLQALRDALNARHGPVDRIAEREAERKAVEAHKADELAKVERRLKRNG